MVYECFIRWLDYKGRCAAVIVSAAVLWSLVSLGSAQQPKAQTPRYQVVNQDGSWWFKGLDNQPFFSFGVCCVDTAASFLEYDPKNPSYAAFKYYPSGKLEWAEDVVQRLQNWNFNTIGAWSDAKTLRQVAAPNLRFTPILHMGSSAGAPWRDMWDPKIVSTMSDVARDQIKDLKNDSRVIGYFSDNEQGWWNGALFEWAWKGPNTRKILVSELKHRYRNWALLEKDFVPEMVHTFGGLETKGRLYLRPGGNGIAAVHEYVEMLSARYYSLCASLIKKFDPGALYLGDRYISNFYPEVARSAGRYADVVSTNLNADWNDGSFSPYFLPSLHRLTQKPLIVTEYYFCAKQNRTGNKNDSSGFPVVETQEQRGAGFLKSTRTFLDTPYLVGAHWFQYYDEPKNGRGDGENYNMGLVDVNNDPYTELTHIASGLDLKDRHPLKVMDSPSVPEIDSAIASDLEKWPRSDAYIEPTKPSDRGDAFVAWTPAFVYLSVYWNEDRFPEAFYINGKVPVSDEPLLTVHGLKEETSARIIDGKSRLTSPIELVSLKMGVRNTAVFRIPASAFGAKSLASGQKLKLHLVLQTRSRAYRIEWGCTKPLSN